MCDSKVKGLKVAGRARAVFVPRAVGIGRDVAGLGVGTDTGPGAAGGDGATSSGADGGAGAAGAGSVAVSVKARAADRGTERRSPRRLRRSRQPRLRLGVG